MYSIIKASRTWEGAGYDGYSCQLAGIKGGQDYTTFEQVLADARKLLAVNPTGWKIVLTRTGEEMMEVTNSDEEN